MMRTLSFVCVVLALSVGAPARADDWIGWGLDGARNRHTTEKTGSTFANEWRYVLLGETELLTKAIVSSPAAADDLVVFGSQRSFLEAIDASTGAKRWRFTPESGLLSSPTIHRGRVYFPSLDGSFYAVMVSDGK